MKAKILIVEDKDINALILKKVLESLDYKITGVALSCEDAIKLIEKDKPDLILMDVYIQGNKNGVETTIEIKEKYDIPVIFLTGCTAPDMLQKIKNTLPFGVVSKPINYEEFFPMIKKALKI